MTTEPFTIKHYSADERPILKGNGFDGLEIGESREEAEAFVAWVNARLAPHAASQDALLRRIGEAFAKEIPTPEGGWLAQEIAEGPGPDGLENMIQMAVLSLFPKPPPDTRPPIPTLLPLPKPFISGVDIQLNGQNVQADGFTTGQVIRYAVDVFQGQAKPSPVRLTDEDLLPIRIQSPSLLLRSQIEFIETAVLKANGLLT